MRFLDEVTIRVISGAGGKGCSSFRREKFVPFGGPDGGDGGRGGSVILVADQALNTLASLRGLRLFKAEPGRAGAGHQRTGRRGADRELRLPVGTLVRDVASGALLADLTEHGQRVVVARGGEGGRGNIRFITSSNRAPRRSDPGGPTEERELALELRLIADVGVIGFPNAGKSTFVARVSAARPRIADYPFTTLVPSLGVVSRGVEGSWVVADVPGIIEGASEGAGLGHRFLRHVQRTRLLLHLVQVLPDEAGSPLARYRKLRTELEAFDPALAGRPEIVVLSQRDTRSPTMVDATLAAFGDAGIQGVLAFSAVTGEGLSELLDLIWIRLQELET